MDIKQFVCAAAYEFLEKHYNELKETPEDLEFKSKEDLFECVKNNPLDAIWCITEIFTTREMGTDYCSQLFIENEEEDIYKATLNGETRYYQLKFDETYYSIIDFVEVKKHTKLVPVVSWIPMDK